MRRGSRALLFQMTHSPFDVCIKSVIKVEIPGQMQLLASNEYLNSSSQTSTSEARTCLGINRITTFTHHSHFKLDISQIKFDTRLSKFNTFEIKLNSLQIKTSVFQVELETHKNRWNKVLPKEHLVRLSLKCLTHLPQKVKKQNKFFYEFFINQGKIVVY